MTDATLPFYSTEKVAVFIDGANLYQTARSLGFDIDYKRLLSVFRSSGKLVRAFYYTALMDEQEYSPIRPLVDWLDYNGYKLITKPLKEYMGPAGRKKFKGNMDVEIAVDVMEMSEHVEHIVLVSGDGDFRRLIEAVQRRGVRASVISTIKSQPPMIADELRRQADFFIDLAELESTIARDHAGPPPRRADLPRTAQAEYDYDDDEEFLEEEEEVDEDNLGNVRTED